MKKYLFLDFDGVLNINTKPSFYKNQLFAESVIDLENLFIVFSTSWREHSSFEHLKGLMHKSIQHKFIDKTPIIKENTKHVRYQEILLFNNKHGIQENQWIALDDMDCLFPKNCPNLILTDPKKGFTKYEAKKIKEFYLY